ncbi:unnamed protein product [Schistosoma guineensis]|nr:unnamed protein product [Schistosoma guineensis]
MADSHSNGKNVCEPSSSPYKRNMNRPLCGIALFGPIRRGDFLDKIHIGRPTYLVPHEQLENNNPRVSAKIAPLRELEISLFWMPVALKSTCIYRIFFSTAAICAFGGNELFGEMKNRLKLRSTGHSDTKESPSEMLTNNAVEQQEPSSYDNTSSSMSANSSPRSSIYDDFEQSESKTVSDILLNRARKPPTRKPTLNRCSDVPNRQSFNTSSTSVMFHPNVNCCTD